MTNKFYVIESKIDSMIYILDSKQINSNYFKHDIDEIKMQGALNGVFNRRKESHDYIINCYTNDRLKTVFKNYAYFFIFSGE